MLCILEKILQIIVFAVQRRGAGCGAEQLGVAPPGGAFSDQTRTNSVDSLNSMVSNQSLSRSVSNKLSTIVLLVTADNSFKNGN